MSGGSLLEFVGGLLYSVEEASGHGSNLFFGTEPLGVELCGEKPWISEEDLQKAMSSGLLDLAPRMMAWLVRFKVFVSCVELCGYGCQLSREVVWWPTTGKLTFALSIKYGGILPGYILS